MILESHPRALRLRRVDWSNYARSQKGLQMLEMGASSRGLTMILDFLSARTRTRTLLLYDRYISLLCSTIVVVVAFGMCHTVLKRNASELVTDVLVGMILRVG